MELQEIQKLKQLAHDKAEYYRGIGFVELQTDYQNFEKCFTQLEEEAINVQMCAEEEK